MYALNKERLQGASNTWRGKSTRTYAIHHDSLDASATTGIALRNPASSRASLSKVYSP